MHFSNGKEVKIPNKRMKKIMNNMRGKGRA